MRGIAGDERLACRQYSEVNGARDAGGERGQVLVIFAILLPVLLGFGALVVAVGSWHTHARHLQTKVDAAAFAGGSAWGFPCGADVDANIEAQARLYVGDHTTADGTLVTGSHNQQVSGVGADEMYVALNQAQWWDDAFSGADFSDPAGSVCEAKVLDVKATEDDTPLLFRWLPLFPDIKRKARVQIEEVEGLTGLLPIAVRVPQPLSAAAVFYDEGTTSKPILAVKPFRQVCLDPDDVSDCILGMPPGLGHWTTEPEDGDDEGTLATFDVKPQTGVVIATSVRPACGAGTPPAGDPCLDTTEATWVGQSVDDFCAQASNTVRCYDDVDGGGPAQTVSEGLHFLLGHPTGTVPPGPNWPEFRGAWLGFGSCLTTESGYFNSDVGGCEVELVVNLNAGSCMRGPGECFDDPGVTPPKETRTTAGADPFGKNIEMKYCMVQTGDTGDACETQFGVDQEMNCTGSASDVECRSVPDKHPQIAPGSLGNAFAVQVRLRNTAVTGFPDCQLDEFRDTCRFFLTGNGFAGTSVRPTAERILDEPIQRSFMGDIERTTPVKWVRLTLDTGCDLDWDDRIFGHDYLTGSDADAANQPAFQERCYVVDLGMAGGLARDQDEPPIAFNLGENSSQRAYVDCDPGLMNLKDEIETGCQWPSYAAHKFDTTPYCPEPGGFWMLPKAEPFANWPPFRCVLTQTGNPSTGQLMHGFNLRIFGKESNPKCPTDDPLGYVEGRNYWHRHNNDYKDDTFAWDGTGSGLPGDPDGDPKGNTLPEGDPRIVTLFFTTYDSFTGTGNEVYPIVGFGNFYITGYGEVAAGTWKGGGPEDPCDEGNGLSVGAGNEPPPDIDMSRNTGWVWGHFVKDVTPAPFTTGGSGVLCNPEGSFQPCVAVLVE